MAGWGQGVDAPSTDLEARATLRRQALDWLGLELKTWSKALDAGSSERKAKVAPALRHWRDDLDLAGIRDEPELAKLPEAEQAGFRKLWADLDQLLDRVEVSIGSKDKP